MKWKGRPQSTNVEDQTLTDVNIPDGSKVFVGGQEGWKTFDRTKDPAAKQWDDNVRVSKDIARRGNNVPTPTPRPSDGFVSHDNIVTPGKWRTKSK